MAKQNFIMYLVMAFISVILFSVLIGISADTTEDLRGRVDNNTNSSFVATTTSNSTLTPIGNGITSLTSTYQNDTWLSFDGTNDYLFIQDNNFTSVSYWVNDSDNEWLHIANASDTLYEERAIVTDFTLNAHKQNATGWYFGINSSGFFEGNIDSINFYNETINNLTVEDIYSNGRL